MTNSVLDADPEMNAILGIVSETRTYESDDDSSSIATTSAPAPKSSGPLRVYTREDILRLCRKAVVPPDMGPLESWFGTVQPNNKAMHIDDPAIAAIGGHGRRGQGGFGEGFGFGGGIGGRGLGRGGTRNIGLRRQPDDPAIAEQRAGPGGFGGGQMGKFGTNRSGDRSAMRLGGDDGMKGRNDRNNDRGDDRRRRDDGDWRRGANDRPPHMRNGEGSRRGPPGIGGPKYDDDGPEPAWMNDGPDAALEDPAIASSSAGDMGDDNLIKFIPGEDMIAAHKRAMKARQGGAGPADNWRGGDKPLVSFFGGAPPAAPAPPSPQKPREVNVASYFKHRAIDDDEEPVKQKEEIREEPSNAFQSRFQRFFGSGAGSSGPGGPGGPLPPPPAASVPPPPPQDRVTPGLRSTSDSYSQQMLQQQQLAQQAHSPNPSGPPPHLQQQPPQPGPRVDDHMNKLMGLLKNSSPVPGPRPTSADINGPPLARPPPQFHGHGFPPGPPPGMGPSPHYQSPPPGGEGSDYMNASLHRHDQRHEQLHHEPSPDQHHPMMPPPHFASPPPGGDPRGDPRGYPYPPNQPQYGRPPMSGELPGGPRPFFDRPPPDQNRAMPPPPELLQLLNNAGRPPMPGGPMPPPMGMLPPHPMQGGMYRGGPSPDDLLRQLQNGPPTSSAPPPGYLPMRGAGGPPQNGPGGPPPHGGPYGPPPPNMQGFLPPQPYGYQQGLPPSGPRRPMPPGMYPPGPGYAGGNPQQQDVLAALLAPR